MARGASVSDNRRSFKRNTIAAIYVMLWTLFIYFIFTLLGPAPPTCFDNIQNGSETGVDCGGSCAPCVTYEQPGVQVKYLPNHSTGGDLVAIITNKNTDVGTDKVHYSFTFLDSSAATLRTITDAGNDPDIQFSKQITLLPGTTRPLIFPNLIIRGKVAKVNAVVWVMGSDWHKKSIITPPQLFVKASPGLQLNPSPGMFAAYNGLLHNSSSYEFDTVDVEAIVKDNQGKIVAVNRAEVNSLRPGEDRIIQFAWPNANVYVASAKESNFQFTATTDVYRSDSIVANPGAPQDFQQLGAPVSQ